MTDSSGEEDLPILSAVPNSGIIEERKNQWQSIFDKYSQVKDGEDDGICLNDLSLTDEINELDLSPIHEAIEDNDLCSDSENNDQRLSVFNENFIQLSPTDKYRKLTLEFDKEYIEALLKVYKKRFNEFQGQNLPHWTVSTESIQATESLSEQSITTPQCVVNTRTLHRSNVIQRQNMTSNSKTQMPTMIFENYNINGQQLPIENPSLNLSSALQLPETLQKLIGQNRGFTVKVLERSYDITVKDDPSAFSKTLSGFSRQVAPILPQKNFTFAQKMIREPVHNFCGDSSSSDDVTIIETTIKKEQISDSDVEVVEINETLIPQKQKTIESKPVNTRPQKPPSKAKILPPICSKKPSPEKKTSKKQKKIVNDSVPKANKTAANAGHDIKNASKIDKEKQQSKISKNSVKRQALQPSKHARSKKGRRRASTPMESSSSDDEIPLKQLQNESKTQSETLKLTLDDISCGSSCSPLSSDDDKFLNPSRFKLEEEKKQLEHRHKKLLMRTGVSLIFDESKNEETKTKKTVPQNDSSDESDDFLVPLVQKQKREAKKVQFVAKASPKLPENSTQPKPSTLKSEKTQAMKDSSSKETIAGKKNRNNLVKCYKRIIDSDSD